MDSHVIEMEEGNPADPTEADYVWGPSCCHMAPQFYMIWDKKNSSRNYNSGSGHNFLIGGSTQQIIPRVVYSDNCNFCKKWNKQALTEEEVLQGEIVGELPVTSNTH